MQQFKKQHQTKTDFEAVGESGTVSQTPLLCACPVGFDLCFSTAGAQAVTQSQQGHHRSEVPPSTVHHMAAAESVLALPMEWGAASSCWRVGVGSGEVLESVGAAG